MQSIDCPIPDCLYSAGDIDPAFATAHITVYNNVHIEVAAPATRTKQRTPKWTYLRRIIWGNLE